MGRKLEMKKIENATKCQVTFSKRRSSLIRKAHEISVFCDVDVALIAFSPSGRLSKFCNRKRIEDVLNRYIALSPDRRHHHIKDLEKRMQMLRQIGHIKDDESKLHYLNNQIKHIELKIKKSTIELDILEANLWDYEPDPERDPSLAQLLWCEKNLKNSLQRVLDRKTNQMGMNRQVGAPISNIIGGNELTWATQNPWISPYSFRVGESIIEDLTDQANGISIGNGILGASNNYTCNFPMTSLPSIYQSGNSSTNPGTQIPPIQPQAMIGNHIAPIIPNQQREVLDSTSMKSLGLGHEIPLGVQQCPTQTFGNYWNNQNWQNSLAPMSWFNANPNEVNWFANENCNTSQNINVILPLNSERISPPLGSEPFYSNTVDKNGGCDGNEKLLAPPSQVNPLQLESPLDYSSIEALMGNDTLVNKAANQEDGSCECDNLALAENLNLEDLEILL